MQLQNNTVRLAIKMNTEVGSNCQLCDSPINPNIGAELVCDVTDKVVCRECGIQYAPALTILLNLLDTSRHLHRAEDDFAETLHFGLSWKEFLESEIQR